MPGEARQRLLLEACDSAFNALRSEIRERLPHQGIENQVACRIKSEASIQSKIQRRKELGRPDDFINDLLGIRVIVSHSGLIEDAVDCVKSWLTNDPRYHLIGMHNFFKFPRSPYYRAIHFDALIALTSFGESHKIGMEIQVTTYMHNYLAAISHDMDYKGLKSNPQNDKIFLSEILRNIENIDTYVSKVFTNQR